MGITIVSHNYEANEKQRSGLSGKFGIACAKSDLLRMDTMTEEADEARLIEGIQKMISQEAR